MISLPKNIDQDEKLRKPQNQLNKYQSAKKSEATIYEGFKGLITAYENRYQKLIAGDEVVIYGLPKEQPEYHHAYWKKAAAKLEKLGNVLVKLA